MLVAFIIFQEKYQKPPSKCTLQVDEKQKSSSKVDKNWDAVKVNRLIKQTLRALFQTR
jgi:hypothetical protein|tara:strand:+ start:1033 stop:1206 length:174 start_codon:yes stop_codon:yes gene_type:complete